ncbi:nitroreductase family protein [Plebeiibacterium sediminum]|uniref:Nitroreductase family protein n=1 Tax=Plebeiibacterium sediminum TaxID=2992112 RepID=A0AAE3SE61_9BACT|nr:nitroreductase family protein [Plebeiobacterium sediminum]MCW3786060.1 nitroreductase family protein [Plebeiobacterium sediminum]
MLDFRIDESKCTQCGLCAQDCPVLIIDGKNGIPEIKAGKEGNCLKCQHCMAICPTGALSILGKNPDQSASVKEGMPSSSSMLNLFKTRRSIRKFKNEELSKELISDLLQGAANAPTGHNNNQVLFSVIDNKADLKKFRDAVYDSIHTAFENNHKHPFLPMLNDLKRLWVSKKIDVILRDAPHVLITSSPKKSVTPVEDCVIALSYFELLANTHGVGTLWNGMLKWVINDIDLELRERLGIPVDHEVGDVMVFGFPAVKYTRGIQTEGLNLNTIKL